MEKEKNEQPEEKEDPTPKLVPGSFVHLIGIAEVYAKSGAYKHRTLTIQRKLKSDLEFNLRQGDGWGKNGIFVSRITFGSVYDVCQLFHVGDEVIQINNESTENLDILSAMGIIFDSTSLVLKLKILTPFTKHSSRKRWKKIPETRVNRIEDSKLINMKIGIPVRQRNVFNESNQLASEENE